MQPRNIEVFDGLRVTTEHIDHLQGAMHSAIADVRELLGLGRVHRGFGVLRIDDRTAQVDPGLAFDGQRRRVVRDDPVILEVPALEPDAVRYVCAGYDEVANGEVEGRPTRVWDSATVTLREALPEPAEDAILLARLVGAETGGFGVEPPEPPVTEPHPTPEAPPAAAAAVPHRPTVATMRLADQEVALGAANGFAAFVRSRIGATGPSEGFRHQLAAQPIELALGRWTLATHCALSAEMALPPLAPASESAEAPADSPPPTRHAAGWFSGTVLVEPDAVLQVSGGIAIGEAAGLSNLVDAGADERAIASLRFPVAKGGTADLADQLARGFRIELRASRSDAGSLELTAWLGWDGEPSQALAAWLDATPARVRARGTATLIASPVWVPPPLPS